MNCNDAQLNILLKSSGELDSIQQKDLDIHLKSCSDCMKYRKSYSKIAELAVEVMPDNGPSTEIFKNINKQAVQNSHRPLIFRRHIMPWVAAAALLLVVMGSWPSLFSESASSEVGISDLYAVLAIVTDTEYISEEYTDAEPIPDMEELLLMIDDDITDSYDITEEELWVPLSKSPQAYNNRGTQQKIYG